MNGQAHIRTDALLFWKKHIWKELNTAISQKLNSNHQGPKRFPRVKLASVSKAVTKRRLPRTGPFIALLVSRPGADGRWRQTYGSPINRRFNIIFSCFICQSLYTIPITFVLCSVRHNDLTKQHCIFSMCSELSKHSLILTASQGSSSIYGWENKIDCEPKYILM